MSKNDAGRMALGCEFIAGYHYIIQMILDAEFAGSLINSATELHRAAYSANFLTLCGFLHQEPPLDINRQEDRVLTPLSFACQMIPEDVVIFLLNHEPTAR